MIQATSNPENMPVIAGSSQSHPESMQVIAGSSQSPETESMQVVEVVDNKSDEVVDNKSDEEDELKYLSTYHEGRKREDSEKLNNAWTKKLFLKAALIPLRSLQAGTQSR